MFLAGEDVPPLPEATTVASFGGEVVLEDDWFMPEVMPEQGGCGSCVAPVVRSVTIDPP